MNTPETPESAEPAVVRIEGHELQEGVDWVRAAGVSFEILFATYVNERQEVILRLEDLSTGNASARVITSPEELDSFVTLPGVIRDRTIEHLNSLSSVEE